MLYNRKFFLVLVLAIFVCLQFHEVAVASKLKAVANSAKVLSTMWGAIKGDVENDGSDDAQFGLLLALQFLKMGNVNIADNGELYINGIAIQDVHAGLIYIDQHAELLSPIFVKEGGYAALNQVLLKEANSGAMIITQHLKATGRMHIGHDATFEGNTIQINGRGR